MAIIQKKVFLQARNDNVMLKTEANLSTGRSSGLLLYFL